MRLKEKPQNAEHTLQNRIRIHGTKIKHWYFITFLSNMQALLRQSGIYISKISNNADGSCT